MNWSMDGLEPCVAPADEEDVKFEVAMLSGKHATITCLASSTVGSLRPHIADRLAITAEGAGTVPRFRMFFSPVKEDPSGAPSAPETETVAGKEVLLRDCMFAAEVADGLVHVIMQPPEPEWCRNKRFKQHYLRGRRCGLEEDEETVYLDLKAGGAFSYHRHDHSHDAECNYSFDHHVRASGEWFFNAGCDEQDCDDDASSIKLIGTADIETVNRMKVKTQQQRFTMTVLKRDLLGGDRGWSVRGGWQTGDIPEAP